MGSPQKDGSPWSAGLSSGRHSDVPLPYEILDQVPDQIPGFPGYWQDKPGESRCNSERMLKACQEV
jgi:hypothetical protein